MSPYFLYQAIRYKKYIGSLRQRLGFLPITFNLDAEDSIWIHAVSVGEALTARALAADLKARYPRLRLFLSTTTIAGQQVARGSLSNVDAVFYFPFDWTFIVRRTLRLVRPRAVHHDGNRDLAEPAARVPQAGRQDGADQRPHLVALVSALPADPPLLPPRARRRRSLLHAERGVGAPPVDLGADPSRVIVTGSLKFDSLRAADAGRARQAARARAALLPPVAEPHGGRRRQHAARRRGGGAPRVRAHQDDACRARCWSSRRGIPERFGEVERLARDAGFVTTRRSELPIDAEPRADVVVLDTIGELAQLYQVATAVFVGGSLVDHGGHNILEPAIFGKPIVFGPHMQNFKEIADAFLANGAAIQVRSERELDDALLRLVTDPVRRARLGAAARALVEANRGAKDKTLDVIADLLPPGDGRGGAVVRPFRLVH